MALKVPLYVWVAPLIVLASTAAADPGDDFSNNLFTDIAPLLALFGERFANQYMSDSMGWLDHIVFAMAPLGILTAITAAIRVGGPVWMKAMIGRARENRATAELELMSSTSDEVCELWNGKGIVRTMGAPEIKQIIYLEGCTCEPEKCYGLHTVDEGVATGVLHEQDYPDPITTLWRGCGVRKPELSSRKPLSVCAPNIALNLHGGSAVYEMLFAACYGIMLQVGALVFIGFSVYHPTFKNRFMKNGRPVERYAYPLMAVGTFLLTLGLLLCTAVVEMSTDEREFISNRPGSSGDHSLKARIIWLQRSHIVSDQTFSASVIFRAPKDNKETLDRILVSQRAKPQDEFPILQLARRVFKHPPPLTRRVYKHLILQLSRPVFKHPILQPVRYVIEHYIYPGSSLDRLLFYFPSTRLELMTLVGVVLGLCGFISQFQGLRGLHWSASIVQLLCLAWMTGMRAWVRRHLAVTPIPRSVPAQHEMDWLALWLVQRFENNDHLWPESIDMVEEEAAEMKTRLSAHFNGTTGADTTDCLANPQKERLVWGVYTGPGDGGPQGTEQGVGLAQKALNIRRRLAQLTRWPGEAAEFSIGLSKSISAVLDILLPESKKFIWPLTIQLEDMSTQTIKLKALNNKRWSVDATQIDAVLSLWLFHIEERRVILLRKQEIKDTNKDVDWLQQGVEQRRQVSRLLGPADADFRRNVGLWIGSDNDRALEVRPRGSFLETPDLSDAIGYDPHWEQSGAGFLAVTTSGPLNQLLAQHLFLSFMWNVVKCVKEGSKIFTETSDLSNPSAIGSTVNTEMSLQIPNRFENRVLTQLARKIQGSGLCTTIDDARLCIVPALCYFKQLPPGESVLRSVVRSLMTDLKPAEVQGNWNQVVPVYTRLLQQCFSWGGRHPLFLHVTGIVLETLHIVVNNLTLLKSQEINDGTQFQALQQARNTLERILEQHFPRSDLKILYHFALLYRFQLRFNSEVWFKLNITKELLQDTIEEAKKTNDELRYLYGYFELQQNPDHWGFISIHKEDFTMQKGQIDIAGKSGEKWRDILGWTPLHYFMRLGDMPAIKQWHELTEKCATFPDASGKPPLFNAHEGFKSLKENYSDREAQRVIRRLIRATGSGVQARDGRSLLHYAAMTGNKLMCELLFQEQANVEGEDGFRQRPIHLAAFYGRLEILDGLLEKQANVAAQDLWGRTAQHLAALGGHGEVIWRLHEASKNLIQVEDHAGQTPLFLAVLRGNDEVVGQLLKLQGEGKGGQVKQDSKGQTLLHLAALRGHSLLVDRLLQEKNPLITVQDKDGRTPLHLAAFGGHDLVTTQLIKKSTAQMIHVQDYGGRTALELARHQGHFKVIEVFVRQRGASLAH